MAPNPGTGNFARSGQQSGFGSLLGLGGGEPEVDNDQINALLQHFGGLSVPDQYQPQGAFESMPWISKRAPSLAYGMDNALIALANMGPTGKTAGENISNVARGLQSIGPTRQAQAMNPMLMALQMAGHVAGLQQSQANIEREGAMAGWYNDRTGSAERIQASRAEAQKYAADQRLNSAMAKNAMLSGKEGQILADGTVGLPEVDDNFQVKYVSHPEIDPKAWAKNQQKSKMAGIMGGSMEGLVATGMLGDDPEAYVRQNPMFGKPGAKGAVAYWSDANSIMLQHREAAAGVTAASHTQEATTGNFRKTQDELWKNVMSGDTSASIRQKRQDAREQQIFMERTKARPGSVTPEQVAHDAQWETQQHVGRLQQLYGQYSGLSEQEQQRQGGVMGFLARQGYDPLSDQFTNRTGASEGPAPNAMPGLPAQGSGLEGYEMDQFGIPRPKKALK